MNSNTDDSISRRIENDRRRLLRTTTNLIETVCQKKLWEFSEARISDSLEAVDLVLKHLTNLKPRTREYEDINDYIAYQTYSRDIMKRTVELTEDWYILGFGSMLGIRKEDGALVAFFTDPFGRYCFFDSHLRRKVRITRKNADQFSTEAILFYPAFPGKALSITDYKKICSEMLSWRALVTMFCLTLICTLFSVLIPALVFRLFGDVIGSNSVDMLLALGVSMLGVIINLELFRIARRALLDRYRMQTECVIEAAAFSRLLHLPIELYRRYSAGELSKMVQYITSFSGRFVMFHLDGVLSVFLAILYLFEIYWFSPGLLLPMILFLTVASIVFLGIIRLQYRHGAEKYEAELQESAISYSLIKGIEKIRITGSEARLFSNWCDAYTRKNSTQYDPPLLLKISETLMVFFLAIGVLYFEAMTLKSGTNLLGFLASLVAFSLFLTSLKSFFTSFMSVAEAEPMLQKAAPILETMPESHGGNEVVEELGGDIHLHSLSYRNDGASTNLFDHLELHILPGEHVGIVGKSGSGKSTLIQLLLGAVKPTGGEILYDGSSLENLDLRSLRQKIGTVLQDDRLVPGTVRENIILAKPWLSDEEVWDAIRMVGLEDFIQKLPLGLDSIILQETAGITGGICQKILLARALVTKPSVLILDEAVSGLDSRAIRGIESVIRQQNCTCISLSHTLANVKDCERIVLLADGKITKSGTYDELKGSIC